MLYFNLIFLKMNNKNTEFFIQKIENLKKNSKFPIHQKTFF